ncbi:MAG TPA: sigma-54 dependent transcriptional regulator [Acidobacteriota bacterium]|nr:sigma-54 dependent transcriptional regulator [Acidobacteriota bacterium]
MSTDSQGTVLIVDDNQEFGLVTKTLVEVEGFSACLAATGAEALRRLRDQEIDVVLLDWVLGNASGLNVLREIVRSYPHLPVTVITGHGSMESAAEALREGAFDYIGKPFQASALIASIRRALEWRTHLRERVADSLPQAPVLTSIIGKSPGMIAVYRMIARVAPTDSTVLIVGESGTGKELVARALHDNSRRAKLPFVAVNCGALPEALLESELFGHVRGSFTGAQANHRGVFETANGGTIFLDEISETSQAFQVKLLRVLQEHEIRPVGASEARRVDARVVAATNRRIPDLLGSDNFRRDLLYRLSVINIELPPLRERREDVALLLDHFLRRANSKLGRTVLATPDTIAWLSSLEWPGNVRELENAVERAVTLNVGGHLVPDDFTQFALAPMTNSPESQRGTNHSDAIPDDNNWLCRLPLTLAEVEREHILATLRFTKGNRLRAADLLGIGRYSLYRKAKRLGIDLDGLSSSTKGNPEPRLE